MSPTVSIIVPVYNCENYIEKCIQSILQQTFERFELILINDGSTDLSEDIILKYEKKDSRIKYFKQNNLGPSKARNNGINKSIGRYLAFIDADDIIDKFYIEKLVNIIIEEKADIVCCGYKDYSIYGVYSFNDFWKDKDKLSTVEFVKCLCSGVGGTLWGKILRKDIITENNLELDNNIYMREDLIFLLEYAQFCKKICVINENLYKYNRMNSQSISSNINIVYLENNIFVIKKITELLKKLQIEELIINEIINKSISSLIIEVLSNECKRFIENKELKKYKKSIRMLIENKYVKENLGRINTCDKKEILVIRLLKIRLYKLASIVQICIEVIRKIKVEFLIRKVKLI